MFTREELSQMVAQYIAALPLPAEPSLLYTPISYSLEDGGKRLRPLLLLMCADVFACDNADITRAALPAAAAIEVFHNFTLLHDDIMDNAPVRRGKPAVHVRWNNNTAILSGDAMVIYAYSLLGKIAPEKLSVVLDEFNRMALGVCEGQQYDIDFENLESVTRGQYIEMIRLKTSVLLAGAAKIGAILGGATVPQSNVLYDFAIALGLAFQIQDDLLDTYGDCATLGKNVGGDITEGKKTFLTVTALERADEKARGELTALLQDKTMERGAKIEAVKAIYDSLAVADTARQAIEDYLRSATKSLAALGEYWVRAEELRCMADSLLNRSK